MSTPLEKWRKTPSLINAAKRLWKNEDFLALIKMCDEEHPKNYPFEMDANFELGKIRGYDKFKNNMEAAMDALLVDVAPEATYEQEIENHGRKTKSRNK